MRIGVNDIAHPGNHTHFIIQLRHDDISTTRNLARSQYLENTLIPFTAAIQEVGMQIAGNVLNFAMLTDKSGLRVILKDPRRHTFIDRFCHDVRTWTGNDE